MNSQQKRKATHVDEPGTRAQSQSRSRQRGTNAESQSDSRQRPSKKRSSRLSALLDHHDISQQHVENLSDYERLEAGSEAGSELVSEPDEPAQRARLEMWPTYSSPAPARRRRGRPPVYGKNTTTITTTNTTTNRNVDEVSILPRARGAIVVPPDQLCIALAMVQYYEGGIFRNPFPTSDENLNELTRSWSVEARRVGYEGNPDGVTLRHLRSLRSRIRSHVVSAAKGLVATLYNLEEVVTDDMTIGEVRRARKRRVEYLLEDDRFMCPPEKYEPVGWRFTAPAISQLVFQRFYAGPSMRGSKDPSFFGRMNDVFLCLITTTIRHGLTSLKEGDFQKPPKFDVASCGDTYERHLNTFKQFPEDHQTALLENLRKRVRQLMKKAKQPMRIRDPEMCQALADPEEEECRAAMLAELADEEDSELDSEAEGNQTEQEGEIEAEE